MYRTYRHSKYTNYYKRPFYRRKGIYIFLILLVGIVAFVSWSIKKAPQDPAVIQQITDQPQAPVLDGKIAFLTGTAQVKTASADWTNIVNGSAVRTGDSLKTATGGRIIVELPDKSLVRLLENSEITFTKLGMTDITIEQLSGTAYHRVNDQSTAIYRVTKGKVELIALGTAFSVTNKTNLLTVTVIESHLKIKIYDAKDIVNMRTVEAGTRATINPGLAISQMIQSEEVQAGTLMANEWYSWNLEQDKAKNFALGIFEKLTSLTITEPTTTEIETDKDKLTIKGSTDKDAKILIANKDVKNNDGQFEIIVNLAPGENKIAVIVKKDNNINQRTFIVNSTRWNDLEIKLSANVIDEKNVSLTWTTNKTLDNSVSLKTILTTTKNPTYPGKANHAITPGENSDSWKNLEPGINHFHVCLFQNNQCLKFSNDATATIATATTPKLSLSGIADTGKVNLTWTNSNVPAAMGFKSLISETPNVMFPGTESHLLTAATDTTDTWSNLISGQTYYFRVCQNLGSSCGVYSNELALTIK